MPLGGADSGVQRITCLGCLDDFLEEIEGEVLAFSTQGDSAASLFVDAGGETSEEVVTGCWKVSFGSGRADSKSASTLRSDDGV